jgi:hypothetical protein
MQVGRHEDASIPPKTPAAAVVPEFLLTTPFGISCRDCKTTIRPASIRSHLRRKHADTPFGSTGGNVRPLLTALRRDVTRKAKEATSAGSFDEFLFGPVVLGFCCSLCPDVFERHWNAERHIASRCRLAAITARPSRWSTCGRLVTNHSLVCQPTSKRPHKAIAVDNFMGSGDLRVGFSTSPSVIVTSRTTEDSIRSYVRADESPSVYAHVFHSVLSSKLGFVSEMGSLLVLASGAGELETDLMFALEVADRWIEDYYHNHVFRCPANLRAALISFDGQVVGDTNMRTTFTARWDIPVLSRVLLPLLTFAWRHPFRQAEV